MASPADSNVEQNIDFNTLEGTILRIQQKNEFCDFNLPKYLIDLLKYKGFDNVYSLAQMNDEDIYNMQKFAREELTELLEADQMLDFFGIYTKKPSLFKIPEGHLKLLTIIIEDCKKFLIRRAENKKPRTKQNLGEEISLSKNRDENKIIPSLSFGSSGPRSGPIKTRADRPVKSSESEEELESDNENKKKAFEKEVIHIKTIVTHYIKKFLSNLEIDEEIDQVKKNNIVEKLEGLEVFFSKTYASVKCIICGFTSKCFGQNTINSAKKKWTLSNFNKHFKTHFTKKNLQNLTARQPEKQTKNSGSILSFVRISQPQSQQVIPRVSSSSDLDGSSKYSSTSSLGITQDFSLSFSAQDSVDASASARSCIDYFNIKENGKHSSNKCQQIETATDASLLPLTKTLGNVIILENLTLKNWKNSSCQNRTEKTTEAMSEINSEMNNEVLEEPCEEPSEEHSIIDEANNEVTCEDFSTRTITAEESVSANSSITTLIKTPQRDSRIARRISQQRLYLDKTQTKITEFFAVYKQIEEQIKRKSNINELFSQAVKKISNFSEENVTMQKINYQESTQDILKVELKIDNSNFLDMLKQSALRNSEKSKNRHRFSDPLKNLSLYLFLVGGRLLYETLCANMSSTFPSIQTLHRTLSELSCIEEGTIHLEELAKFLDERGYSRRVFVSEDQTAVVKRIRYDSKTNKMVGFTCPLSISNGFPETDHFVINSVKDIENAYKNSPLCINAHVFLAQPLHENAPSFCIALFGTDNKFTWHDVNTRWKFLEKKAKELGIIIEGFATDGDTRCLKTMKICSQIAADKEDREEDLSPSSPYYPYYQGVFSIDCPVYIQDTIHISTKIKSRILNPNIKLPMGKYFISKVHLENLIKTTGKDKHLLYSSYLDNTDKMNFEAIDKLSSPQVTDLLIEAEAKATKQILIITRYVLDAFLDKSITVEQRIYFMWYSVFFLRIWGTWIKSQSEYTLSKNWLTTNVYTCIELNAHSLLIMIEKCRMSDEGTKHFLPWLFSSQPCEKFFRQIRSMTSTYSTIVNFDMLDILQRINRVQVMNDIIHDHGNQFIFPRELHKKMGTNNKEIISILPCVATIKSVLENAKAAAITDAQDLGLFEGEKIEVIVESILLQKETVRNAEEMVEFQMEIGNDNSSDNEFENSETPIRVPITEEIARDAEKRSEEFCDEVERITKDISEFPNLSNLDIKDYGDKAEKTNNSVFLKIISNNKTMTVRKSTLCWLYFERSGKLSTDRLTRVRGMTQGIRKKLTPKATKKSTKKLNRKRKIDTEPDASSFELCSEFECADFDLEEHGQCLQINSEPNESQHPIKDKYYAVYYDVTWYLGRVVETSNDTSKIKFLKSDLNHYIWPKKDDISDVQNSFIFFGPLVLKGNGPFTLARPDKVNIEKQYKELKRRLL